MGFISIEGRTWRASALLLLSSATTVSDSQLYSFTDLFWALLASSLAHHCCGHTCCHSLALQTWFLVSDAELISGLITRGPGYAPKCQEVYARMKDVSLRV
jgi:hypothetical protein